MKHELKEDRNGALHDERGYFVGSGNPGGRKPMRAEAEAREAVQPFLSSAVDQLRSAVEKGQAWAILETLNRGYGKATDRIAFSNDDALPELTDDQIAGLLSENGAHSEPTATE